jgi:hypothetical protein
MRSSRQSTTSVVLAAAVAVALVLLLTMPAAVAFLPAASMMPAGPGNLLLNSRGQLAPSSSLGTCTLITG